MLGSSQQTDQVKKLGTWTCRCLGPTRKPAASEDERLVRTLELRLRALRGQGDGGARGGAQCNDEDGQLHLSVAEFCQNTRGRVWAETP